VIVSIFPVCGDEILLMAEPYAVKLVPSHSKFDAVNLTQYRTDAVFIVVIIV